MSTVIVCFPLLAPFLSESLAVRIEHEGGCGKPRSRRLVRAPSLCQFICYVIAADAVVSWDPFDIYV